MPSLTVKNIPDELYQKLKQEAAAHHRSLNSEIIFRIEQTLSSHRVDAESFIERLKSIRAPMNVPPLTDDFLKEAKEERRS